MKSGSRLFSIILLILALIFLLTIGSEGAQEPASQTSLTEKIDENDDDLRNIELKIGKKKYTHQEERININSEGQETSRINVSVTDFEKEIALKLLNIDTGVTEVIKITKRGINIISPRGYDIRVVKRVNGIQWNGRNTHFKIIQPERTIVVKNAWPEEATRIVERVTVDKKGKKKTTRSTQKYVRNNVYVPYSTDDPNTPYEVELGIHTSELIVRGTEYSNNVFQMARQILIDRKVRSRAFPQYMASDLPFIELKVYQRLNLTEQMDLTEFYYSPNDSAERVLVILGANQDKAFTTCNSSNPSRACGMMQFTDRWRRKNPGTYSSIVRSYPEAKLLKSFPAGAFDHVNVAMAAILLHDYNLDIMINMFGSRLIDKISQDPVFTEMILGAAYNGSPTWVHLALKNTAQNNFEGWSKTRYLREETRGYLAKIEFLITNNMP